MLFDTASKQVDMCPYPQDHLSDYTILLMIYFRLKKIKNNSCIETDLAINQFMTTQQMQPHWDST